MRSKGNLVRLYLNTVRKGKYFSFYSLSICLGFFAQIVLLSIVIWLNRNQIDVDAVSYIRIAQYFLNGQTDLMISGYWGPLLSWLIVPWLLVFDDPLHAAHVPIAISAIIFLFGSFCLLRTAKLSMSAVVIGTWTTALLSVAWAAALLSPDLLMAGLLCIGISMMLSHKWPANAAFAIYVGLILGSSFLAKPVALPISVLIILGFVGTKLASHQISLQQAVRGGAITVAGLLIVAGPWIGVLSYKYARPTFSTSARINHAIVGPPDVDRAHPTFRTFHKPPLGRVTTWEDPTIMPYKYWSPFENTEYALHQARVVYHNFISIVNHLKSFDLLGLGLVSAILAYVFAHPWRQAMQGELWRWSLIPIAGLSAVYLPVYAGDSRYFLAIIPFLLTASLGFVPNVVAPLSANPRVWHFAAVSLVAVSFLISNELFLRGAFKPSPNNEYVEAKLLARTLLVKDIVGPVVSVGMDEADLKTSRARRMGYYLAFLSGAAWYGQMRQDVSADEVLSSGAVLIVLPHALPLAKQLRDSSQFSRADTLLGCKQEGGRFDFDVYLIRIHITDHCPENSQL